MNSLTKMIVSLSLCALLILTFNINSIFPEVLPLSSKAFGATNTCKCVIFRFDDIGDEYLDDVQIRIMDIFLSKEAPLSLGLVMHDFGNDTLILNKISEGYKKGLFELALHGWNHVNFSAFSKQEQKSLLQKANEKMQMIFGQKSDIFIPPFNKFNNATVHAMKELGIRILSAGILNENMFDQGKSIFNVTAKKQNSSVSQEIFHLPFTTDFKDFVGPSQVKIPIGDVAKDVSDKIDKFGFAVVIIHPDTFIKLDESGNYIYAKNQTQITKKDIKDLEYLIDRMRQEGIQISSFHKVLDS